MRLIRSTNERARRVALLDRHADDAPPRASTVSRPTIWSAGQSAPLTSTSGWTGG